MMKDNFIYDQNSNCKLLKITRGVKHLVAICNSTDLMNEDAYLVKQWIPWKDI